ncbi:MAG: twin-arginine translocation signal domain-containing protein, partial [Candidatus Hydrogenedentes bacterium]|nr:twin-arginine translocation signal domain-containing protein [Candidatus Hydrogenedentota bacterium]
MMQVTRRNFLKASALGTAGLLPLLQLKAHAAVNIRLGACDWSFREKCNPKGFENAKAVGLDGLEISATDEAGATMKIADPAYRQTYKEAVKRTGITISSIAMGCLNNSPFASDKRAPAWLEQSIEAAADLDAKVVLLAFFGDGDLLE